MRIDIYDVRVRDRQVQIIPERRVAVITVDDGVATFDVFDKSREALLRAKFSVDVMAPVAGGETDAGDSVDAWQRLPAWSLGAIRYLLEEDLPGFGLGGTLTT